MDELENVFKRKVIELEQIIIEADRRLLNVPEGRLRITTIDNYVRYYQTGIDMEQASESGINNSNSKQERNGNGLNNQISNRKWSKYISCEEKELAQMLAQKEYDLKVKCIAEEQLKGIQRLAKQYKSGAIASIYENLHPKRKELVSPIIPTDEEFLMTWKEEKIYYPAHFTEQMRLQCIRNRAPRIDYEKNTSLFSDQGDNVRSKSEAIISQKLERYHIPYKYECSLFLEGKGWVFPDFTVLNRRTRKTYFWEHLGMMGDMNYASNSGDKLCRYQMNGFWPGENLILTMETKTQILDTHLVDEIIKKYLL